MLLRLGNINLSQMYTSNVILFQFYSFIEINCSCNKTYISNLVISPAKMINLMITLDIISDLFFFYNKISILLERQTQRSAKV